MIRDPSDGSVRGKTSKEINLPANETSGLTPESASKGITSALAANPIDAKESARLIKSREWLAQYRKWDDGVNRMIKGEMSRSPEQGEG